MGGRAPPPIVFKIELVKGSNPVRYGGEREASNGTFLRHNRYYMWMCIIIHFIAKIRFQLGQLVPNLLSEDGKSRFRALEVQKLSGEHVPGPLHIGASWLRHSIAK